MFIADSSEGSHDRARTDEGQPFSHDPDPELRASHEDRVVEILRISAGDGRLTGAELDQRLEAALEARTDRELEALTADLPLLGATTAEPKDVVRLDY